MHDDVNTVSWQWLSLRRHPLQDASWKRGPRRYISSVIDAQPKSSAAASDPKYFEDANATRADVGCKAPTADRIEAFSPKGAVVRDFDCGGAPPQGLWLETR